MKQSLLLLFAISTFVVHAQTTSVQSGNWNAAPSWDIGVIPPNNGDTVFIEAGYTISINTNTAYTNALVIMVRGTFTLNQTLTLASGSRIVIEPGGTVNSGNNGWRLNIGAASWKDFKNDPQTGGVLTDIVLSAKSIEMSGSLVNNHDVYLKWNIDVNYTDPITLTFEKSINGKDYTMIEELHNAKLSGSITLEGEANNYITYFRIKVVHDYQESYSDVIKTVNEDYEVKCYPNPFADKINLNSLEVSDDVEVKIVDILGNEVYTSQGLGDVLDVSGLERGIYFLNVMQQGYPVQRHRLVKK